MRSSSIGRQGDARQGGLRSLQLLPGIRQVATALAPDADQLPSRLEAPARATPRTGQAGVPA